MSRFSWVTSAVGVAATSVAVMFAVAAPASAVTVNNHFERSCNFGSCSRFIQTNGPYVASVGSDCYTKSYTGQGASYRLPPGSRCTP